MVYLNRAAARAGHLRLLLAPPPGIGPPVFQEPGRRAPVAGKQVLVRLFVLRLLPVLRVLLHQRRIIARMVLQN